jgi:hypothetical protein
VNPDIEERLRILQPAAPPADLMKRLLDSEPPAPGKIRWLRLLAAPAAAAAAIALLAYPLWRSRPPAKMQTVAPVAALSPDFRVFVPIKRTSTLLDVHDIAIIDADPSRPIRFVRATWLDDTTYAGDDGHSTMHRQEPRTTILSAPLNSL